MRAVHKRKPGRPRIPIVIEDLAELEGVLPTRVIEFKQVLYWMDLQATQEEIAGSYYVSVDTLSRRLKDLTGYGFADLKEKCCGGVKIKLRHNQMKLTERNATMGIWLGKQWLNQRDLQQELQEFNGSLAILLEKLGQIKTSDDFNKKAGSGEDKDNA